jgi:hypothetical protein
MGRDELTLVFADGTTRHILDNTVPLRRTDRGIRGAVSAFIDVTERKRSDAGPGRRPAVVFASGRLPARGPAGMLEIMLRG